MIAFGLGDSCSGDALWVINADGSDAHPVASTLQPSWSPDSRRLVFVSYSGLNSTGDVAVVNVDGSGYRPISTPGPGVFDLTWAPRGAWIAYDVFLRRVVRVVRADGAEEYTVASGSFGAWSPDGRRIAYLHRGSLRIVNRDGKRGRLVVRGLAGDPVAWSPNGKWITYVHETPKPCPDGRNCLTSLYVVDANGERSHALSPVDANVYYGRTYWSAAAGVSSTYTWFRPGCKPQTNRLGHIDQRR